MVSSLGISTFVLHFILSSYKRRTATDGFLRGLLIIFKEKPPGSPKTRVFLSPSVRLASGGRKPADNRGTNVAPLAERQAQGLQSLGFVRDKG